MLGEERVSRWPHARAGYSISVLGTCETDKRILAVSEKARMKLVTNYTRESVTRHVRARLVFA